MATFFINTIIHSMMAIVAVVALVAILGTSKRECKACFVALAKRVGIGYMVYHSDSQKYFYTITRKSAVEWLGATYADAVIFSNWSKEALQVVTRKQQINFA